MKKKLVSMMLAAVMGLSLAACGTAAGGSSSSDSAAAASQSSASAESTGASAANTAGAAASGEKVKLVYYGWTDEQEYLDKLFAAFNAQSKDAEIEGQYCAVDEYEEVVTSALSAKTPIDVLAVNGLQYMNSYQEKGYLTDMTQYASAAGFDPKSVYGDIYSGANQNGMYGIPYRMAVWFMFYNKTMLDDLGITVQTDKSYTWDEYADLCIKTEDALKAAGKDIGSDPNNGCYAGLVGMNKEMTIQQRGARFDDQDTSAITEMWDIWHKLDTDGTHVPYAEKLQYSTNAGKVFWTTGRVAFFQNATWGIANYNKDPADGGCDFDYRCMKMPVPDGVKDNTNPANPNYFGIPVTSSHPEQAYEFIQWACTNGGAKILAESSVLPAYADDEVTSTYTENAKQKDDVLGQIISSPNNCLTDLCFPGYSEVLSAYEEQMESYMVGNETEDEALANFVSKRDEILKAQ